jgi:hypothetical protein
MDRDEDRDSSGIRYAQPFNALHRRRLAGAVRPDETEDLRPENTSSETSCTARVDPYDFERPVTWMTLGRA